MKSDGVLTAVVKRRCVLLRPTHRNLMCGPMIVSVSAPMMGVRWRFWHWLTSIAESAWLSWLSGPSPATMCCIVWRICLSAIACRKHPFWQRVRIHGQVGMTVVGAYRGENIVHWTQQFLGERV